MENLASNGHRFRRIMRQSFGASLKLDPLVSLSYWFYYMKANCCLLQNIINGCVASFCYQLLGFKSELRIGRKMGLT